MDKLFLSRFSNSLAKRNTKVFDFEVEPEHPHKTYNPGDAVKGQIVLSVFKGFDITHLTISLHGYARVVKHQLGPGEAKDTPDILVNGKGSHGFEYHGNGLASLFQDEQILCGSGFLKKQVYKFGFELQFPSCSLPSTIEFERGDVNYVISASVTRPTAIVPLTNRIYKVKFKDKIDIGPMYVPKSRAIYLEPMTRRSKVKKVKHDSSTEARGTPTPRKLSGHNTSSSTQTTSTMTLQDPPSSPVPSENTVATHATSSTHSLNVLEDKSSHRQASPDSSEPRSSTTSNSAQTISATTEILRHGALPGESVSIRVKVEHTRVVRGIVIATLFRQSRVDMHPPLPIATRSKKKKLEYEDVYPRSRTGLGGLYFTDGTPNRAFRKDLSQAFTMMIVNPQTKMADIKFSIKIPNDAFPTMDNIPGGMISFTYHIEVVVDLTGKLGDKLGESRLFSLTTNGPSFTQSNEPGNELTTEWTNNILDTAPLRRTRNVAAFELPLTIGTEDSSRARKSHESNIASQSTQPQHNQESHDMYRSDDHDHYWNPENYAEYDQDYYHQNYEGYGDEWYDENGNPLYDGWHDPPNHYTRQQDAHYHIPPPQDDEHLDEKSRLRRQEELLLPSAPPETEASLSNAQRPVPSAPTLDGDAAHHPSSHQPAIPITISRASARSGDTIVPGPITPPPSLPENETIEPLEDKQELERQRLLAQVSAPPIDDDPESGPSHPHSRAGQAPSAPVIDEEEYIAQALRRDPVESLPLYHK